LTLGKASDIWGFVREHEAEVAFVTASQEDIQPEDIIASLDDAAQYRVLRRRGQRRGPYVSWNVERLAKPIVP